MSSELPAGLHPEPTAISRFGPLVGVLASIAMCVQNVGSALALGWGLIHGAGLLAVIAFLPLAFGLGLLWTGLVFLRRRQVRHGLPFFVAYATVLLVVNEWLLPTTPLKAASSERALKSAEVLSIRDEIVATAAGDPLGLRIVFEVRFPTRVVANVSASGFAPSEKEPPWLPGLLDFAGYEETIEPIPNREDIYEVFEEDVVYRVEVTRMPGFRGTDYLKRRPCVDTPPGWSDDEIFTALRRRGNRPYRLNILGSSPHVGVSISLADYQTSRPYDLEAMYRTVMNERLERCQR